MRRSKDKEGWVAVAWAAAGAMRRNCNSASFTFFPAETLTRSETRHLNKARGYLDAAEVEIRKAQGSLAERSKLAGHDRPDYERARKMN